MAAGLGFKTFTTGEVLTAGDVNGYLMQGINVFASSAARASAITSPQEGQYSFLKDTNALEYYDGAAWVGAPVGDITAVTAGTGISGGGSSGAVTITNSMATEITAKGDLIAGTGSATFDNLPVGTNGQTLVADSTASTGLKWATSTPTFAGCLLTNAASQSIAYNTATALTFDTERIDTDAYHSTATNTSRITIPAGKAGKYLITWRVTWAYNTSGDRGYYLYKNGTVLDAGYGGGSTSTVVQQQQVTIATLAASDYLEVFALQTIASTGALNVFCDSALGLPGITQFGVEYLGA